MRQLSATEQTRLSILTAKSINITLIEPTKTGLKKSILDATEPVRRYLCEHKVHDYDHQKQGKEHKVIINAYLVEKDSLTLSRASLYKPNTKKGDPRIWFQGLPKFSKPNDILAIIAHENELYVINLTKLPLEGILQKRTPGPLWNLVNQINLEATHASDELLQKLKTIAQHGPTPSCMQGYADTAIGRTLETLLGIAINSRKQPDYKGIELKSSRSSTKKESRKNLFAQVANWELSKFKSSQEILENFGYYNCDGEFKLYCTVSTLSRNSQGLKFKLNQDLDRLIENSDDKQIGDFAVWLMDDLRKRLLEKHNETFWVTAKRQMINGTEHFQFTKVLHTRKPIPSQFDILVEQGIITMDHLIKRDSRGTVSEKGPLFKIESSSLEMLFPPSQTYDLLSK